MSRPRGSAHELVTAMPAMGAAQARIRLWHHPDPNRLPYFYSSNVQKGHRSAAIKARPNAKQSPQGRARKSNFNKSSSSALNYLK